MSIQSRIESDLSNQPVSSQSRIEQILNGEDIEPKSRIEALLKEGGRGDFTIFEVVDGTAKGLTSSVAHYLYDPNKEVTSETHEVFDLYTRVKIGLFVKSFDERYANVICGLAFQGYSSFECYTATGQWFKVNKHDYDSKWWNYDEDKILYNLTAFEDYHPALADYLAVETEIPISTTKEYSIGEVFDTGLTEDHDIMIWLFTNGDIWLFRFPKGQAPVATIDSDNYVFNIDGYNCTKLNANVGAKFFQKIAFNYEKLGTIWTSISAVNDVFLAATFDVKNTNGEIIFAKNADIGEYI